MGGETDLNERTERRVQIRAHIGEFQQIQRSSAPCSQRNHVVTCHRLSMQMVCRATDCTE